MVKLDKAKKDGSASPSNVVVPVTSDPTSPKGVPVTLNDVASPTLADLSPTSTKRKLKTPKGIDELKSKIGKLSTE